MTQPISLLTDEKIAQIRAGKTWDFHGGIHPAENKKQSNQTPISDAGIPPELVIAVEQKGHIPPLLVSVGDLVLAGQPLTQVYGAFVVQHASSSGIVKAIEPRADCHPSGLSVLSIVIETDGLDTPYASEHFTDYSQEIPATLVHAIQQAGIVGLGGAGFPSHLKLTNSTNRLLIINAIECEPYITADDRLIQEHASEIIDGLLVLQHILQPQLTIFAIEDNKKEAIAAFSEALEQLSESIQENILIKVIPTRYPSGSEKQLIEVITGEQTPAGKHPAELGIVMNNVGTVFAIKEAIINGKPLTSRIVTVTGEAFTIKGNVRARIGTPLQYLLDRYQFQNKHVQSLIIGGPMMGFSVYDSSIPVSKSCNCILAPTTQELPPAEPEMSCIRCSECAEFCPVELLPQQLLWYSQSEDFSKLETYSLSACIECGVCAFVCPSHIPLVEYYRVSKAKIKTAKEEAEKAVVARQRHENRALRLENEKQQRKKKHQLAADKRKLQMQQSDKGEDLITAALARAKAKKLATASNNEVSTDTAPKKATVAAAIARAKAKKLATANNNEVSTDTDPKKAAVAAAIARAKAKKSATANNNEVSTDTDPKKAALAAAIARAKAKKLATANNNEVSTDTDPKKAAVAAAIARAKAKKLASNTMNIAPDAANEITTESKVDAVKMSTTEVLPDNRAVIAQRALRKEQAALSKQSKKMTPLSSEPTNKIDHTSQEENTMHAADDKKNKIAAAVAKAQKLAKKDK